MATKPSAKIRVGVDDKAATAGLKRMVRNFKRSATQINQSLELLGKAWGAVTGAIGAAVGKIGEFVKLSIEQERVERRAIAALQMRGKFTQENFKELQRFNSALQQSLGFGDEQLLQLQGTLAAMGVNKKALQDATKATIGLAEATGQDLKAAGLVVAKALGGQTSALSRYGIVAKSTAEAQKKLTDLFRLAESQAGTVATGLRVLDANIGDVKETLGEAITRSSGFRDGLRGLNSIILEINKGLADEKGLLAIDTFFRRMVFWASQALNVVAGLLLWLRRVDGWFDQIKANAKEAFAKMGPAGAGIALSPAGIALGIAQAETGAPREGEAGFIGPARPGAAAGGLHGAVTTLADLMAAVGLGSPGVLGKPSAGGGAGGGGGGAAGGRAGRRQGLGGVSRFGIPLALAAGMGASQATSEFTSAEGLDLSGPGRLIDEENYKKSFAAGLKHFQKYHEDIAEEKEKHKELLGQFGQVAVNGISNMIGGMISSIVDGSGDLLAQFGQMLGGIITQLGQMLIQLGTAALLAAALGAIPIFRPLVGDPTVGVGVALAAIAGGAALVAGGAALGKGSGGAAGVGGRAPSAAASGRGPSDTGAVPAGFVRERGGGNTTKIYNITFGRTFVGGSPAEVGREIRTMLREADRLEGAVT